MKFGTLIGRAIPSAMALVVCATLAGCGDGLKGNKYTEEGGKDGIEFKSGGKALVTVMGSTFEADYTVDGDKITLDAHNGPPLKMTHTKDDTLTGAPGMGILKRS